MSHDGETPLSSGETTAGTILAVFLVVAAGGTAGLQIALFSIDRVFLRVLGTTGTAKQRRNANRLLGVLDLQHWTLVALTLLNASCMMSLPIVLEHLLDEMTALIVSVTAVLFLGEVIPLSIFVRWAIPICAFFTPVVWFAIVVTAPVSYPVGKLLDRLLGTKDLLLDREDIAALIMTAPPNGGEDEGPVIEADTGAARNADLGTPATTAAAAAVEMPTDPSDRYRLRDTEVKMLHGAMLLSTDTVLEHLRVREPDVFMLSSQDLLDGETIKRILMAGFSRVPVYFGNDRKHVIGTLIVNTLLKLCYTNPHPPPLVGDYHLREAMRLPEDASLYDAYVAFRDGPCCMAAVHNPQEALVGILTLTDVLASMYHANPEKKVSITAYGERRREKLRELIEGMKYLNAAKSPRSPSFRNPIAAAAASTTSTAAAGAVSATTSANRGGGASVHASLLASPGSTGPSMASSPGVVVTRPSRGELIVAPTHSLTDVVANLPQFTLVDGAGNSMTSPPVPSRRNSTQA